MIANSLIYTIISFPRSDEWWYGCSTIPFPIDTSLCLPKWDPGVGVHLWVARTSQPSLHSTATVGEDVTNADT